ncbi:conjugation system SOS inhibitor PsiB family protein, partial [Klebsiella pneumoniae]|uniref:conjugation system SOS inhibitor PsiB family protein n=1 Tax=Klebsiella pneumoniae TaxID=573 RepID=UPI002A4E18BC
EWVHVQLHQQKGMISLSPPTICNSARFTPSHGNYHIAVCSPGAISPAWMVVFVPASGRPFSVIRTLSGYQPELVSHTVSLTARLDADGYSQASIISILAAEGAA